MLRFKGTSRARVHIDILDSLDSLGFIRTQEYQEYQEYQPLRAYAREVGA